LYVALHAYLNKSSAVAEMRDRFATIDMGRKLGGGGAVPIFVIDRQTDTTVVP